MRVTNEGQILTYRNLISKLDPLEVIELEACPIQFPGDYELVSIAKDAYRALLAMGIDPHAPLTIDAKEKDRST